jgi:hypothetical protein
LRARAAFLPVTLSPPAKPFTQGIQPEEAILILEKRKQ